ncbi:MAG TPA: UDP-glucose/GDP-mannose dehydrogenase family protein [Fimbriimonas sp.]|nr:UDP-glucose/GDP-mannose dehydrogenase family protein [Fimbriimonas sp.]
MKIAVIGTGYVGLVTGVVLARLGNDVICVDKDPAKIDKLSKGIPTIYEPGIEEMLRESLQDGFLTVSDSIAEATHQSEIIFIAVGTPPGPDGAPDVSAVRAVAKEIGENIKQYTVVVNKSTVPVGSGDMVEEIILANGALPHLFDVVSNPEFLREGSAIRDTMEPDRIVIGAKKKEAAQKLVELYSSLGRPTIVTSLNSAELIKYAANSFLAMKISFINAISRIAETCGADVADVAKGMGLDQRIGAQFLQAGLGWGGSCFPKDVQGLVATAARYDYDFRLLQEVIEINDSQTIHFLERIEKRLGTLKNKTVALMGLAFKPNTDDIRDAKSLVMLEYLLSRGARVRAHDPIAVDKVRELFPNVEYVDAIYDVAEGADVLVLVTEWNEYRQIDLQRLGACMKSKILFDGRRLYRKDLAQKAGFDYFTIGS